MPDGRHAIPADKRSDFFAALALYERRKELLAQVLPKVIADEYDTHVNTVYYHLRQRRIEAEKLRAENYAAQIARRTQEGASGSTGGMAGPGGDACEDCV